MVLSVTATLLAAHGHVSKPNLISTLPPPSRPSIVKAVPLLKTAIRLADFSSGAENMQPSPELAESLTHIDGFTQSCPHDGGAGSEATEVWTGRTATAVYFIFSCHDHQPSLIRTHLARREHVLKDDRVSVLLDPFQDHRRDILFTINPSGIQADAA